MTSFWAITSPKIIFGANFWNIARMHNSTDYVKLLEKLLEPFLEKWQKPHFWAIFYVFWPKLQKLRKISKIRLDRFFSLKCPLLRAKFRKNCWSGFRETAVTDGRTEAIL